MNKQEQIEKNRKEFEETGKLPDYLMNDIKRHQEEQEKFGFEVNDLTPEGYGPETK